MKDVVAVKKWALPEDERPRRPFPWEVAGGLAAAGPQDE